MFSSSPSGPCTVTLTTTLSPQLANSFAWRSTASRSVVMTSTESGCGATSFAMCRERSSMPRRPPVTPSLKRIVGLVVTPRITPMRRKRSISLRLPVSRKIGIVWLL